MPRSRSKIDRVAYGKLIHAFIRAGWNPPRPSERVFQRITDDIARVQYNASLRLSPYERTALRLAAEGMTVQETANHMGIGFETAKMHLKEARRRLGARNTSHAVALALRSGELVIDDEELAA